MRINRLYTGIGDWGRTRLGDNTEVPKDHPRIRAGGALDLANAAIGCVRAELKDPELDAGLERIQHRLFDVGGLVSIPGKADPALEALLVRDVADMEKRIDAWTSEQAPLTDFILPGGTPAAARLHEARCRVRAAERVLVSLDRDAPVGPKVLVYLNRLADFLFAAAREVNRRAGVPDTLRKPGIGRSNPPGS
jgi:cob(I)alamin adenosyltransferase